MLRVGLTGGIATGKSTVATMFRELGCHVLEADKIAHQMIEPGGAAYDEVVREFGSSILDAHLRVDRPKLGSIVFADPNRLSRLNAIVHPPVLAAQDKELLAIEKVDPHAISIVVAALLIEGGYYKKLDRLVVTWCKPEQQFARLTERESVRGLTAEQIKQRIGAQMPAEEKRRMADDEVDCSVTLEQTGEEVAALFARLKVMEAERSRG